MCTIYRQKNNMGSIERLLLQSKTVFSIQDAGFIWNLSNRDTLKKRIVRLTNGNKIRKLKRGLFYLKVLTFKYMIAYFLSLVIQKLTLLIIQNIYIEK